MTITGDEQPLGDRGALFFAWLCQGKYQWALTLCVTALKLRDFSRNYPSPVKALFLLQTNIFSQRPHWLYSAKTPGGLRLGNAVCAVWRCDSTSMTKKCFSRVSNELLQFKFISKDSVKWKKNADNIYRSAQQLTYRRENITPRNVCLWGCWIHRKPLQGDMWSLFFFCLQGLLHPKTFLHLLS